jgi:arylsulfatase A
MSPARLLVPLVVCLCLAAPAPADERPNVMLILADDLGLPGVSAYGGPIATPQLDALAQSGTRFDFCFSAPLCGPSRAMLLTGRYGFRTGVVSNETGGKARPEKDGSIARTLHAAGYATAVAGKWRQLSHLVTRDEGRAWGFDEFLIWGAGDPDPAAPRRAKGSRYWSPDYNHNGKPLAGAEGKYGPDLLHEFVVDFIGRHRDRPFFIYYPMPLVHAPIERTPDSRPDARPANERRRERWYADNVRYMDKLVGKLVAELERLKLRERTLVLFVGDNGSVGPRTLRGRAVDGHKGTMQEGGSRVPLIANWPSVVPAGATRDDLVDFTDFYPTLAELAGAAPPGKVPIDGRSFAPQLRGQKGSPREWVFVQLKSERYVRDARWKLTGAGQLFDLRDAPFAERPASTADDQDASAAHKRLSAALERMSGSRD